VKTPPTALPFVSSSIVTLTAVPVRSVVSAVSRGRSPLRSEKVTDQEYPLTKEADVRVTATAPPVVDKAERAFATSSALASLDRIVDLAPLKSRLKKPPIGMEPGEDSKIVIPAFVPFRFDVSAVRGDKLPLSEMNATVQVYPPLTS
jgi:hypothetical protein